MTIIRFQYSMDKIFTLFLLVLLHEFLLILQPRAEFKLRNLKASLRWLSATSATLSRFQVYSLFLSSLTSFSFLRLRHLMTPSLYSIASSFLPIPLHSLHGPFIFPFSDICTQAWPYACPRDLCIYTCTRLGEALSFSSCVLPRHLSPVNQLLLLPLVFIDLSL